MAPRRSRLRGRPFPRLSVVLRIELVKLPPVSTDVPTPETGEGGPEHLLKAVQRELAARGATMSGRRTVS